MSSSYKVLAPYVTTKVKDVSGQSVTLGYYRDGVIHDPVDQAHVDALVDLGMLEKTGVSADEAPADGVPKGNASREEWAVYAKTKGATDEELAEPADGGLSRDELRELYGN